MTEETPGGSRSTRRRHSRTSTTELALEKLADRFDTSARRWELIVYPSLFAFVILAGYGFFLIYSLTQDMHVLARSMDSNMGQHMSSLTNSVESLAMNVDAMTSRIEDIADGVQSMNKSTASMDSNLGTISLQMSTMEASIVNMDFTMRSMNLSTGQMTYDMRQLNKNMGRPMSMMNNFLPW